jgi:putative sterol carrier protein
MGTFTDADDVYKTVGAFLEDITASDDIGPKFAASKTSFHIHYSDPTADMLVDCTGDKPSVRCGDGVGEGAEIQLTMNADDGHRFWLGKLNMTIAMAKGQVKAKGPIPKILKLVPLTKILFPRYRDSLVRSGRTDLVEA